MGKLPDKDWRPKFEKAGVVVVNRKTGSPYEFVHDDAYLWNYDEDFIAFGSRDVNGLLTRHYYPGGDNVVFDGKYPRDWAAGLAEGETPVFDEFVRQHAARKTG